MSVFCSDGEFGAEVVATCGGGALWKGVVLAGAATERVSTGFLTISTMIGFS